MLEQTPEKAGGPNRDRNQPKHAPRTGTARGPSETGCEQRESPRDRLPHQQGQNEPHPQGNACPFWRFLIRVFHAVYNLFLQEKSPW